MFFSVLRRKKNYEKVCSVVKRHLSTRISHARKTTIEFIEKIIQYNNKLKTTSKQIFICPKINNNEKNRSCFNSRICFCLFLLIFSLFSQLACKFMHLNHHYKSFNSIFFFEFSFYFICRYK